MRGMMSESVVWGTDGCRNAKFRSVIMPEYEAWIVEERCQKVRFGKSRKGVGKRGLVLECRGKVSERGFGV